VAIAFDAQSSLDFAGSSSFNHTPVGTPKGVVVIIGQDTSADNVTAVTYGGVAMTRVRYAADTSGEAIANWMYFLGAAIPTGVQSVSITVTGTDGHTAWCGTITAAADTEVNQSNVVQADVLNPSITLPTSAGFSGIVFSGITSGVNAPASITGGASFTEFTATRDYGIVSGKSEYRLMSGANVVANWTIASDDVAMTAAAIQEIASVISIPEVVMAPYQAA
jgi:hypothetical protein